MRCGGVMPLEAEIELRSESGTDAPSVELLKAACLSSLPVEPDADRTLAWAVAPFDCMLRSGTNVSEHDETVQETLANRIILIEETSGNLRGNSTRCNASIDPCK